MLSCCINEHTFRKLLLIKLESIKNTYMKASGRYLFVGEELSEEEDDIVDRALLTLADFALAVIDSLDDSSVLEFIMGGLGGLNQS